jgi:ribosomal protein S18 acetylase RimI-like enzyme
LNGNGSATLSLRPAQRSDLRPLSFFLDTALRNDYFIRRGQLAELVSDDRHQVYVAEVDSVLVGVAITTRGSRLINALVHPNFRGIGIGKALVNYSGATEVRAKRDMSSGDPKRFYNALGFRSTGKRNEKGNIEIMKRKGNAHGK